MKLSREWLGDYVDLDRLTDDELAVRFTQIGHAVESMERHGDDTVFDLEITTNRVDAMSHLGMGRELAAALGRELKSPAARPAAPTGQGSVTIRIDAPEMCARYTGLVLRGVKVGPSSPQMMRRLEAVGLRPINNVVDVTNYVMLALGHPLHAFDLDKVAGATIVVRAGKQGETLVTLDGQKRAIDPDTVVIADAERAVALGGIMGGGNSEITEGTTNVLLECAWFEPSVIRRSARRLGMKTDASYRFERRVDPNDTVDVVLYAAELLSAAPRELVDVVASPTPEKSLVLRSSRLKQASAGVVSDGYALELFRRLGFHAESSVEGVRVTVPTWRGDISEEMDLVEEVLRFYGFDNVPAELPRLTTGDAHPNVMAEAEDVVRTLLAGCGLDEAVTYSFVHADWNALFSDEQPVSITNSLSENIAAMRLSIVPGLLEVTAFNRSYGNRDGGLFEVGRTYHRAAAGLREVRRAGFVLFGSAGTFWGDAKRPYDFYDAKGLVEQIAAKFHVSLTFDDGSAGWLRSGRRAVVRTEKGEAGSVGYVTPEVLSKFGIKGDVLAGEIDLSQIVESAADWKMAPVARYPGVPMILAMTHRRDLAYERIVEAIRSFDVPHLHEVGLRDRFVPENDPETIKTTLGMWYQAFDRSLTQEEVSAAHQGVGERLASLLPIHLL